MFYEFGIFAFGICAAAIGHFLVRRAGAERAPVVDQDASECAQRLAGNELRLDTGRVIPARRSSLTSVGDGGSDAPVTSVGRSYFGLDSSGDGAGKVGSGPVDTGAGVGIDPLFTEEDLFSAGTMFDEEEVPFIGPSNLNDTYPVSPPRVPANVNAVNASEVHEFAQDVSATANLFNRPGVGALPGNSKWRWLPFVGRFLDRVDAVEAVGLNTASNVNAMAMTISSSASKFDSFMERMESKFSEPLAQVKVALGTHHETLTSAKRFALGFSYGIEGLNAVLELGIVMLSDRKEEYIIMNYKTFLYATAWLLEKFGIGDGPRHHDPAMLIKAKRLYRGAYDAPLEFKRDMYWFGVGVMFGRIYNNKVATQRILACMPMFVQESVVRWIPESLKKAPAVEVPYMVEGPVRFLAEAIQLVPVEPTPVVQMQPTVKQVAVVVETPPGSAARVSTKPTTSQKKRLRAIRSKAAATGANATVLGDHVEVETKRVVALEATHGAPAIVLPAYNCVEFYSDEFCATFVGNGFVACGRVWTVGHVFVLSTHYKVCGVRFDLRKVVPKKIVFEKYEGDSIMHWPVNAALEGIRDVKIHKEQVSSNTAIFSIFKLNGAMQFSTGVIVSDSPRDSKGRMTYTAKTTTVPGSSGCPVLIENNGAFTVVGLHMGTNGNANIVLGLEPSDFQ